MNPLGPGLPLAVEVRDAGAGRGRGLFARRDIARGEALFTEEPLASAPLAAGSRVRACARCLRSLAPPLAGLPRPDLWPAPAEPLQCTDCAAWFCDRWCRDAPGHAHLLDADADGQGLQAAWPPEFAGLRHFAQLAANLLARGADVSGVCGSADDALPGVDVQALAAALGRPAPETHALISKLCRNAAHLRPQPPFQGYFSAVRRLRGAAREEAVAAVLALAPDPDDLRSADAHFNALCGAEGGGLFELQSKINHSCLNNCEVRSYGFATHAIDVVATRDIAEGDELTICYVDPELETEARQEALQLTYGFQCACDKCTAPQVVRVVLVLSSGERVDVAARPADAVAALTEDFPGRVAREQGGEPLDARQTLIEAGLRGGEELWWSP